MEPFPEDLLEFMSLNIESVEQLEVLRLLGEDRARDWDAASLSIRFQATPFLVGRHLTALTARGLIHPSTRVGL